MKLKSISLVLVSVLGLTGCASIFTSKYQTVSVNSVNENSEMDGAKCRLKNNKGLWEVTTPGDVKIRKSPRDLEIFCEKEGASFTKATVDSSVHPMFFGNVVLGGIFGMLIDYTYGPGFSYPKEIVIDNKYGYVPGKLATKTDTASTKRKRG
jgi:hypothetical protein